MSKLGNAGLFSSTNSSTNFVRKGVFLPQIAQIFTNSGTNFVRNETANEVCDLICENL
jgi:hypothetical protein